jgi:hypothetical protein
MKKYFVATSITAVVLFTVITLARAGRYTVSAGQATQNTSQSGSIILPNTNIYGLTTDNMIYVLTPGANRPIRLTRVTNIDGNLIGLDFRPADRSGVTVYGVTDSGNLYLINLAGAQLGVATFLSNLSPRFAAGVQSLMDFNPVVNALRLIGSNDQNFAVVNSSGGNLNMTAVQTAITYARSDVNAGVDPNLSGGAYTNNFPGAPNTLFYAIDYDLDTFVTISTRNATGSSNTGGGVLQTIGQIVDPSGAPLNFNPTADIDIYTDANGVNTLVGLNNERIFTIDLAQIDPSLQLGTTQKVISVGVKLPVLPSADAFIDIAIPTAAPNAAPPTAPAPTPTPTPTPAPAQAAISPVVDCVIDNGNGRFTARFGYINPNTTTITIPVGDGNKLVPTPPGAQPTSTFFPGRKRNAFSVTSGGGNIVWVLNGKTATASLTNPTRCP